ncbi:3-deoxy-D-manno-octulosonic acid transferase [Roseimaritima sediminicola]|uniref:3-deoxy-D-manno-octulosonic acid transferase n=1 Tax=Roseimaritima sediminicola TaxID=2662066 RepID=UPI0012983689|nr:3-deoxy-D-manno-octulosonic acid transferase [Roseimaritima sediminicola]
MWFNAAYLLAALAVSPWLLYRAIRHGKYRRGWRSKLLGHTGLTLTDAPTIWLHAVSVGEVNLLRRFASRLAQRYPDHQLVISSTTVTGHALACQHFGADRVFYCPLDFTWAVRRVLRQLRPEQLILAELEVWPNLIRIAHRQGVPVAVINGRLSENSFRGYRRLGRLVGGTFGRLSCVAAQNETYAERFHSLGVDPARVHVTGSLKFDDAPTTRDTPAAKACAARAGLTSAHRVWLAGSTQAGEETVVLAAYRQLLEQHPDLRLILVPRHAERFERCAAEVRQAGFRCVRRSETSERADAPLASDSVFLVDAIGELRDWWATAEIAFVGGSLGSRGGQNMLEPAGYGAAVCFGPNTRNFRDIVSHLLAADAATVVHDQQQLAAFVQRCLEDEPWAAQQGTAAQAVVRQHRGATERTLNAIAEVAPLHRDRAA